jgi:NADH-quinone oxidoreductase subunit C
MNAQEIHQLLLERFGPTKITGVNLAATDPWVEVDPAAIREVSLFCRDDDRLRLNHLNNLSGVDYFEPDPKKAPKYGHEPHIEVVYHLSSFPKKHKITLKVKLPRWKDGRAGEIPEVDSVADIWGIADWHERETYDLMGIRSVRTTRCRSSTTRSAAGSSGVGCDKSAVGGRRHTNLFAQYLSWKRKNGVPAARVGPCHTLQIRVLR